MSTLAEDTGVPIAVAAEQIGVHPRTLRRYIADGRLNAVRYTSQVVRIHKADLDVFLEGNIRVVTGTGICYVPRQDQPVRPEVVNGMSFLSYKGGERRATASGGRLYRVRKISEGKWAAERMEKRRWAFLGFAPTSDAAEGVANDTEFT